MRLILPSVKTFRWIKLLLQIIVRGLKRYISYGRIFCDLSFSPPPPFTSHLPFFAVNSMIPNQTGRVGVDEDTMDNSVVDIYPRCSAITAVLELGIVKL